MLIETVGETKKKNPSIHVTVSYEDSLAGKRMKPICYRQREHSCNPVLAKD